MGLDTTHDCWHGAYSSFHKWRKKIAEVAGYGDLDKYVGHGESPTTQGSKAWPTGGDDPLAKLLHHSDCDGSIEAADCGQIADRLASLLPSLAVADRLNSGWPWYVRSTETFIAGLRKAAAAGEDVEFH